MNILSDKIKKVLLVLTPSETTGIYYKTARKI